MAVKGSVDDTTGVFTATSDPGRPSPELAVTTPAWPAAAPMNVAASAAPSYTITGLTPETGYTVSVKARIDLGDDGTLDESVFTVVSATTTAPAADVPGLSYSVRRPEAGG